VWGEWVVGGVCGLGRGSSEEIGGVAVAMCWRWAEIEVRMGGFECRCELPECGRGRGEDLCIAYVWLIGGVWVGGDGCNQCGVSVAGRG
jgi:hypothetical protein